jgi:hypothetical protein
MTKQHSVGPPDELTETWIKEWHKTREYQGPQSRMYFRLSKYIAICAAQWGADQELDACCEWLREVNDHGFAYQYGAELARKLRAARRTRPPSLKEQAHRLLETYGTNGVKLTSEQCQIIVSALENSSND